MAISKLFLYFLFVFEVNSMALKGPVLTRYDPCGLGVIHFDKVMDKYWRGVVYFGLYSSIVEAEMVMTFKTENTISAQPVPSLTARRKNKLDLILNASRPIPERYVFYVLMDSLDSNNTDVPYITSLRLNNVSLCDEKIKALQTITSLNITVDYKGKQYAHVCGRRSIDNEELISVRTDAKAGDWPWHVAMMIRNERTGELKYQCGGTIVSTTAIVTAGHCVFKNGITIQANKLVILAGINNHKDVNQVGRQQLNALDVILHPAYVEDLATSDLAIIRVSALEFNEYVQPICIWGPVYDKTNLFGKEATVVGFGSTEYNKISDTLRSTYIMVQNDTTCIAFAPKLYKRLLNEFTFCAGYGPSAGINPRNGDSGGGLVVSTIQTDHKISWFLRGVLSKCGVAPGHKECDPKYYVVYTDVGPHYSWIYHNSGLQFRTNVGL